jgi:hypothetical protein
MPMARIRYTLADAVGDPKTWAYTWEIADDVTFASTCGFCGQDEQRLTYEVTRDEESLWICQRCVGRYPVTGIWDGELLDQAITRANIHGLTARQKQRTCQEAIKKIQAVAPDAALSEVVVYFERNLQLSPQCAAVLFTAMAALPEPLDPRIFDIQTRSMAHQDEFGALDDRDRSVVWPALSPQQRRRLSSLGYAPSIHTTKRTRPSNPRNAQSQFPASSISPLCEPATSDATTETSAKTIL